MTDQKNSVARKMLANLARRYRFARRMAEKADQFEYPGWVRTQAQAGKTEAWNAYQASKRIFLGLEP